MYRVNWRGVVVVAVGVVEDYDHRMSVGDVIGGGDDDEDGVLELVLRGDD